MFYFSIVLIVVANVIYHVSQKSIPAAANPVFSSMISYVVALATCAVIYPFYPGKSDLATSFKSLNWSSYVIGLTIVGVEVGFLLAYRAGWNISIGSVVAGTALAILLIPVGIFIFKEQLSVVNILGILFCITGLFLITKK